jgi:tRNA threonylcarbamoyladenosine biosynthesis protein TsaE
MNLTTISNSPDDSLKLGERIAAECQGNELILLTGDLGTGKTIFTKGLFIFFGLDESQVVSPTFTILNQYRVNNQKLYHLDLYRLTDQKVLNYLPEIDDHLENGIIVVEWAQYLHKSYARLTNAVNIRIEYLDYEKRKFHIYTNKLTDK